MAIDALNQYNPHLQKIMAQGQHNLQMPKTEEVNAEAGAITGAVTAAATMGAGASAAATGAAAGIAFGGLTGQVEKPQGELFKTQVGASDIFKAKSNQQGTGYQTPVQNYHNGLAAGNVLPEDATKMFIG